MTPKKATQKHRDATVVYPGTSPQLMLAYRIFGPGHESIEALVQQRQSIIKHHRPEDGEGWLTPLGMDISRSMKIDVDEINAAYKAYKKEIKRMNKADRIHENRKQAQLDGVDPEDMDEDEDDSDDSDEIESSSSSSGGQHEENGSDKDEANDKQDKDDSEKDEDRYKQYLNPDLWLSKEEALTRTRNMRATIEEMNATVSIILDNYNEEIPATKECNQAMDKSVNNFLNVRRFAYHLENLIKLHDNKKPEAMWVSPDLKNITFGERVPEALYFVHDLQRRVEYMHKALFLTNRVRTKFLKATTLVTKKQFMAELMFNLRRFAAMACTKEKREEFLGRLKEERQRFSMSRPHGKW